MDKEKLEKAAWDFATKKHDGWKECEDNEESFIAGAQWLLSQPLSERLTEREAKDIINYYNPWCDEPNLYMQGVKAGLRFAFGTDLFTNQPND